MCSMAFAEGDNPGMEEEEDILVDSFVGLPPHPACFCEWWDTSAFNDVVKTDNDGR